VGHLAQENPVQTTPIFLYFDDIQFFVEQEQT
jgi:hypothetical protein